MLKTYRVRVKFTHYKTYQVYAHNIDEAKITYDEGEFCSTTEAEPESCTVEQVKHEAA